MGFDVAGTDYLANEGDREGVYRIVLCVTVTKKPERNKGGKAESLREISVLRGRAHGGGSDNSSHDCGPGGRGSGA